MIYASDSFAGAILEILAHVTRPRTLPGPHHAVRIDFPDDLVDEVPTTSIPGWDTPESGVAARRGDRWLTDGRYAVLSVPSLPARPIGHTLAINQEHADIELISVSPPFPVPWDERVF